MPLRIDYSAWNNFPGVLLALQPGGAPGPMDARRNMANGENNSHQITAPTPPPWSAAVGWTFTGTSSQFFRTDIMPFYNGAVGVTSSFVRYSNAVVGMLIGASWSSSPFPSYGMRQVSATQRRYEQFGERTITDSVISGVRGINGSTAYMNGVNEGTIPYTAFAPINYTLTIGALSVNGGAQIFYTGNMYSVLVACRPFTTSEVLAITQQMKWAHLPDAPGNVWKRRRKWYYASAKPTMTTSRGSW